MPQLRHYFIYTLLASIILHAAILCVAYTQNNEQKRPEFTELHIKLGHFQKEQKQVIAPKTEPTVPELTKEQNKAIEDFGAAEELIPTQAKPNKKLAKKSTKKQQTGVTAPVNQQGSNGNIHPKLQEAKQKGNKLGNTANIHADVALEYEELLPLWLNRFKPYPDEAKQAGLEGWGVIHIRIDRSGNVISSVITESTGYDILDKALIEMVRNASRVLPVPEEYEIDEEMFSYEIGMSFSSEG